MFALSFPLLISFNCKPNTAVNSVSYIFRTISSDIFAFLITVSISLHLEEVQQQEAHSTSCTATCHIWAARPLVAFTDQHKAEGLPLPLVMNFLSLPLPHSLTHSHSALTQPSHCYCFISALCLTVFVLLPQLECLLCLVLGVALFPPLFLSLHLLCLVSSRPVCLSVCRPFVAIELQPRVVQNFCTSCVLKWRS